MTAARMWRLLKKAALMLSVAFAVAMIYGLAAGWMFLHPGRSPAVGNPQSWGMAYRSVHFGEAVRLSGWWVPGNAARPRVTIVLAHGYLSNRSEPCIPMLAVMQALHDMGDNVLSFDFRAHGTSEGTTVTIGARESGDVRQAVSCVRQRLAPSTKIVVLGYSMGASTAILAAEQDPAIAGVIADSPYDSLQRYLAEDLPVWHVLPRFPFQPLLMAALPKLAGIDLSQADPAAHLQRLGQRPLLIIAGSADTLVPVSNAEKLFARAHASDGQATLWIVRGAGHIQAYKTGPPAYVRHLRAFLQRWQ